ncbi:hypothetical protein [Haloarcula rubripromontorii]|uniref:hypothetical protein n=1 Tax=Haloarcula rubripromontorii TaxID=1705562 RepID=UPI00345BC143
MTVSIVADYDPEFRFSWVCPTCEQTVSQDLTEDYPVETEFHGSCGDTMTCPECGAMYRLELEFAGVDPEIAHEDDE